MKDSISRMNSNASIESPTPNPTTQRIVRGTPATHITRTNQNQENTRPKKLLERDQNPQSSPGKQQGNYQRAPQLKQTKPKGNLCDNLPPRLTKPPHSSRELQLDQKTRREFVQDPPRKKGPTEPKHFTRKTPTIFFAGAAAERKNHPKKFVQDQTPKNDPT